MSNWVEKLQSIVEPTFWGEINIIFRDGVPVTVTRNQKIKLTEDKNSMDSSRKNRRYQQSKTGERNECRINSEKMHVV